MTIDSINAEETIQRVANLIAAEQSLSPALKSSLEVLLLLVSLLLNRLGLNSKNSSKPPSTDPFRSEQARTVSGRKPGGQLGHVGATLKPVSDPDIIKEIAVDRSLLPPGRYQRCGHEARQVIDLDITTQVTEWRAEVVVDEQGRRHVAPFPEGVTRPVQYGTGVKVNAVYMSQYQMVPYNRIEDHFLEQMGLPVSSGSIVNFNRDAFDRLGFFEQWVQGALQQEGLLHVDETGINVGGKRCWLHNVSSPGFCHFAPPCETGRRGHGVDRHPSRFPGDYLPRSLETLFSLRSSSRPVQCAPSP